MNTCLQGLFRKILNGHIKPGELVKMTPEELASKELARWREFEAKHVGFFLNFGNYSIFNAIYKKKKMQI